VSDDHDRELRQRAAAAQRIPHSYVDPLTGARVGGSLPVVTVSEDDIRRYGSGGHTCGECKHFELGHGQAQMAAQEFMPKLVRDYEWKLQHAFLSPSNEMGLCGNDDITLTGVLHAACEHFRPHNGKIKREAKASELETIEKSRIGAQRMQQRRIRDWRKSAGLDRPPKFER
jgi:hypothetical protein